MADAWDEANGGEGNDLAVKATVAGETVTVSDADANRSCPFCNIPLKAGQRATACPVCKILHHQECWREAGGCANDKCES
ncbi:MAG: RING finger protein [Syntrophomonadaceae bacterium]|nr:RING finger protein [Syntrophomonadaceae bacterium]